MCIRRLNWLMWVKEASRKDKHWFTYSRVSRLKPLSRLRKMSLKSPIRSLILDDLHLSMGRTRQANLLKSEAFDPAKWIQ